MFSFFLAFFLKYFNIIFGLMFQKTRGSTPILVILFKKKCMIIIYFSFQRNGQEAAVIMNNIEVNYISKLLKVEVDGVAKSLTQKVTVSRMRIKYKCHFHQKCFIC